MDLMRNGMGSKISEELWTFVLIPHKHSLVDIFDSHMKGPNQQFLLWLTTKSVNHVHSTAGRSV